MNISFVRTVDESLASFRYRIKIPTEALIKLGHNVRIIDQLPTKDNCDFLIFSKHFHTTRDLSMALEAKKIGIKVVYDICDNHFVTQNAGYYREMSELADIITCNTLDMKNVIHHEVRKIAHIVDDPYEFSEAEPSFNPSDEVIKLLWYGHGVNLNTIAPILGDLSKLSRPVNLRVISNSPFRGTMDSVKIDYIPWSQEAQMAGLAWCDMVIIPTILNDQTKRTKSHNRVTEAIRSGKFVVAHPLPSYLQYKPYAWIDERVGNGVEWAYNNPDKVIDAIQRGQAHIARNLSPENIALQWEAALSCD